MSGEVDFPFIKGMTFGYMAKRGDFATFEAFRSFDLMVESLNINTVVLPIVAWQKNARSSDIVYESEATVGDLEVENMIDYAHKKGVRVILKPVVNILDGTSRADINFLDKTVRGGPSWEEWFKSYGEYIMHIAAIARQTGCSVLSVGSGLSSGEARENDWRRLISAVREVYGGFITYDAEKYREDLVAWWDAVDIISSSGYCSFDDFMAQKLRIEKIAEKYKKPFILLGTGRKTQAGAPDFQRKSATYAPENIKEQAESFKKLFCREKDLRWFYGCCLGR